MLSAVSRARWYAIRTSAAAASTARRSPKRQEPESADRGGEPGESERQQQFGDRVSAHGRIFGCHLTRVRIEVPQAGVTKPRPLWRDAVQRVDFLAVAMTIPFPLSAAGASARDPLQTLRAYHGLAPWSLRDLAAIAGTLLEASGIVPVNVAARARPSERTIRFYVMKGLVDPPEGRGTAAVYRYRHLLQVLAIKLRQMEGASLEVLAREFTDLTGDVLERRVAAVLGPGLPDAGGIRGAPVAGAGARAIGAGASPAAGGDGMGRRVRHGAC